ncbi:MAG TPA: hypothetical protein VM573_10350 [Actinomycetota bacterium]|nr:hypothetical protein [Actinomycetota bacterium]
MRRAAAALAAVAVVLTAAPAAGAGAWQRASAIWVREHRDRATAYIVFAARRAGDVGVVTTAGIGKIACRIERTRRSTNAICNGRVAVANVPTRAFVVHPALDRAELRARVGGRRARVEWAATEPRPRVAAPYPFGSGRIAVRAVLARGVRARGSVAGVRVRASRRWHSAELGQGAAARIDMPRRPGLHRVRFTLSL